MNARLIVLGVIVQAAALILAIAGNYLITYHLIQQRETVWCPLLASVTAHAPPHPAPAQARAFRQLVAVRAGLGCLGRQRRGHRAPR